MKIPAFFAAAILAVAATAAPTLAMPHQGADMLRASLSQSLRGIGIGSSDLEGLSLSQLAQLRGIVSSNDSDGTKAFRARTLFEQAKG